MDHPASKSEWDALSFERTNTYETSNGQKWMRDYSDTNSGGVASFLVVLNDDVADAYFSDSKIENVPNGLTYPGNIERTNDSFFDDSTYMDATPLYIWAGDPAALVTGGGGYAQKADQINKVVQQNWTALFGENSVLGLLPLCVMQTPAPQAANPSDHDSEWWTDIGVIAGAAALGAAPIFEGLAAVALGAAGVGVEVLSVMHDSTLSKAAAEGWPITRAYEGNNFNWITTKSNAPSGYTAYYGANFPQVVDGDKLKTYSASLNKVTEIIKDIQDLIKNNSNTQETLLKHLIEGISKIVTPYNVDEINKKVKLHEQILGGIYATLHQHYSDMQVYVMQARKEMINTLCSNMSRAGSSFFDDTNIKKHDNTATIHSYTQEMVHKLAC